MSKEPNIIEIENEYKRIDSKWLRLHFHTSIGLVLFGFFIECILGFALYNVGEINLSIQRYIIKYFLTTITLNLFFISICYWAVHSSWLAQRFKSYFVSLLLVAICFVFFSVHSVFVSLYLIFTIPMLFTIVYGDYNLTTVTSLCSILAKVFSELFVKWDFDKPQLVNNNIEIADFIISLLILCVFYVVCIVIIHFEREKNAASIQKELERHQLKLRIQKDELTKINNRTALKYAFRSMEDDTSENTYIFVMVDIDNFKFVNDTLGHDEGDLFLIQFSNILKTNCADAIPFRFGGDEFCILFKNYELKMVIKICEKIQNDFRDIAAINYADLQLTVSFGIANYRAGESTTQLLKNADSALYSSKTIKNAIRIHKD